MADVRKELEDLLRSSGAKLIRSKKHNIYALANGKRFVMPKTPSDNRAWANSLSDLRYMLGMEREPHREGERRERRVKVKQAFRPTYENTFDPTDPKNQEQGLDFGLRLAIAAKKLQPEIEEQLLKDFEYKAPRKARVEPSGKHGKVRSIPPDIINNANVIGKLHGDEARQNYLTMYMEIDRIPHTLRKGNVELDDDEENGEFDMDLRKMIEETKKKRDALDNRISEAHYRIAQAQAEITTVGDLKNKADQFITQLEGTLNSFKDVEAIFEADKVRPLDAKKNKNVGGLRPSREGIPPVGKIVNAIADFMETTPETAYNAKELLQHVNAIPGFERVDTRALHSALSYGSKRNGARYARNDAAGKGYYSYLRVPAQSETSSVAA